MSKSKNVLAVIDNISEWVGRFGIILIVVMMMATVYEVVARYVFHGPTIWSLEINRFLLAAITAFGGGYALLRGSHVKVDLVYARFGDRRKAIIDLATSVLFFTFIGALLWKSAGIALSSLEIRETNATLFAPPVYPLKIALALGFLIILLQGLAKFIRDINTAITGKAAVKMEKGVFER